MTGLTHFGRFMKLQLAINFACYLLGYCELHVQWMTDNCCKTCEGSLTASAKPADATCRGDKHKYCHKLKVLYLIVFTIDLLSDYTLKYFHNL